MTSTKKTPVAPVAQETVHKEAEASPQKITVKALGIACEVDTDLLDDLDFFEDINRLQGGDIAVFPRMLKTMFGESWEDVKRGLADTNGRVRVTKATEFFMAVFEELNAKNS